MVKLKELCIAPYTGDLYTLLKIEPEIFRVKSAVTPSGICPKGADVSYLCNRRETGVTISDSLESAIIPSDAVLIPPMGNVSLSKFASEITKICKRLNKPIVDSKFLRRKARSKLKSALEGYKEREVLAPGTLRAIGAPVVFICSLFDRSDSFEVLQSLSRALKLRGHNPLTITSNEIGTLYDNVVLSLDLSSDYENSIIELNGKMHWMSVWSKADIVLIELPRPVSEYSRYIHYDFGVLAYALSKAIPPDGVVLCTSLNLSTPELISNVCDSVSLRLGAAWWMAHIGNQMLKIDNDPESRFFRRYHMDEDRAIATARALRDRGVSAFCCYDGDELNQILCQKIEMDFFNFYNEVIG